MEAGLLAGNIIQNTRFEMNHSSSELYGCRASRARGQILRTAIHTYHWPSKGVMPGVVLTAVVAADMIWMIVCFWRKRTFECFRSVSAIGPFTP